MSAQVCADNTQKLSIQHRFDLNKMESDMLPVKVEIGTSSPVDMSPDAARQAIKAHLYGKDGRVPFEKVILDDEKWMFSFEMKNGSKVTIVFPEEILGQVEVMLR